MSKTLYKIYHANLAFSAIPEEKLSEVITKCYFPLLELVENTNCKIALEISAYSLELIQKLQPLWIERFNELLKKGAMELIGSGYMQIIGPLVPYEVNIKNQKLGLEVYENILSVKPNIVFVNEQVLSSSMIDLYYEIGYEAIVMEWNNAFSLNKSLKKEYKYQPVLVKGLTKELPVIWSDSVLFQQFQRFVHSQKSIEEYLDFFEKYTQGYKVAPLYTSDLEIFNFRPGRFETEELIVFDEWERISDLVNSSEFINNFELPSNILKKYLNRDISINLVTNEFPIIVKKQDKYSLSRWSACGRGANYINTLCYRYFKKIESKGKVLEWKKLLKYWGSDFRTHITIEKWEKAISELKSFEKIKSKKLQNNKEVFDYINESEAYLSFEYKDFKIKLNKKKALSLDYIYFKNKKIPIGTVHHGELDFIKNSADFYSGTTIIESAETKKISNLSDIEDLKISEIEDEVFEISGKVIMKDGFWERKSWIIDINKSLLTFDLSLSTPKFVNGSIRLGILTLDKDFAFKNGQILIKNGGNNFESIHLKNSEINHHIPKSLIQSSISGLGCTSGEIKFINDEVAFSLELNREKSYPFILLQNNKDTLGYLTRLYFSVQELDDTLKFQDENLNFSLSYKINLS